jgi:hypothetical protein
MSAYIEQVIEAVDASLQIEYPAFLTAMEAEHNDGIRLEPFRVIEWEEVREIATTPALLLIANAENDPNMRDQAIDCDIQIFVILQDRNKRTLTKKLFRYAECLRRWVAVAKNRTLSGLVISVKILRVDYSAVYTDRSNLFCRDFQASLQVRYLRRQ